MNISLTPDLERFIQAKIASGQYELINDIINEGLRLLMLREEIYQGRFEELQQEIMIGIEQLKQGEGIDGATAMRQLKDEILQRDRL